MLFIDASVIERFARIGDIASTNESPERGLASLLTIIDDPGNTVEELNANLELETGLAEPSGYTRYILLESEES